MKSRIKMFLSGILFVIYLCIFNVILAQQIDYTEFISTINELEKKGELERASEYLHSHRNSYPYKYFELSKEEIYINEKLLKFEENLSIFNAAHQKGYFYFIHPNIPQFKPYKDLAGFDSIYENDLKLRNETLLNSKTIYEVELPERYKKDQMWPLCLIFHGGGSNLEKVKENWHSDKLNSDFIKVYFQSYRHYDSKTFGWGSGDERADKELIQLFSKILNDYSIDTTKILVAGMSAGGTFAIDISIRQVIPVTGFITFCPGIPKILGYEHFQDIPELNIKGYMVGGANDYYLPRQKQMADVFNQLNIPHKHIVIDEMGHQYPINEGKWIDEAIHYMLYSQ